MIGRGMFRHLTSRLYGPGVPNVRAEWFSRLLKRKCGAELAWHRKRRVFVVLKRRGRFAYPWTYMDLGTEHFPLHRGLLQTVANFIALTDAKRSGDPMKMLEAVEKAQDDQNDAEIRKLTDDMMPDIQWMRNRALEYLGDGGVRRRRFIDLGAAGGSYGKAPVTTLGEPSGPTG